MEEIMTNTEKCFESFLKRNGINYCTQVEISGCPFTKNKKHKVDFYLPDKDLHVEVKGQMTLFATNVLNWLLNYSGKQFYILQMTEEDWIEPFDRVKHKSIQNKKRMNINKQFTEIVSNTSCELSNESKKRLQSYISYRNGDIARWNMP
ncbi:MAG: hypothetical protein IKS94_03615 [Prevotella sp.]|nr:hypothetical protein [Prevotella sp.]